ncbi:heme-binding protein (plasmid) [Sphingobium sp. SJ10-10]|uniref:GlcG/HbpS family heme-binding protein n=1 Tax=Sphingobium sp. SJ10-10 TaxID=3114999 RepID=UPI002E16F031|nr:heme-binding protein [Sphingobium sp. SJ10-10]
MSNNGVSLTQAQTIVDATLSEARKLALKPMSVAVLDAGGHMVAFAREDGSSTLRPQISTAKASGALALGVSSRVIGEMAVDRPTFIAAAAGLSAGGIIPAAGGLLIRDATGQVVGAVGVTGDTSDSDELCALAGVSAAGLSI